MQNILLVIVVILIIAFIYSWRTENLKTVRLFYRKNCKYCRDFMKPDGQWEKFKKMCMVNPRIDAIEINTLDPKNQNATKKYASDGVPSIVIFRKGTATKYTGPRTAIDLYQITSKL